MTGDDLLVRLARAIATTPSTRALSESLCLACRDLAGADSATLTVGRTTASRVTLFATDDTAARLEDLQEILGEGPGHTAARSGELETCSLQDGRSAAWPQFAVAALDLVGPATLYAVPMRPDDVVFGVMTLYQVTHAESPLAMEGSTLLRLAAATGSALVRDPQASATELGQGPWQSRARVHQATGMIVAQLRLEPEDALAVLKAHAYAGETTLADVAGRVIDRTLRFHPPDERGQ